MGLILLLVALPTLLYWLSRKASSSPRWNAKQIGFSVPRFHLWQLSLALVFLALLFVAFATHRRPNLPAFLLVLMSVVVFFHTWRQEFVFMMSLRDEDFPGRHDKLVWTLVLLFLAPLGIWFFRAYRLTHWPESPAEIHSGWNPGAADLS